MSHNARHILFQVLKTAIASLLLLFLGLTMSAQQIRNYGLQDGLPQSQVNAIVEDDEGYLWIATNGGGLCRFDGKEFEVFNDGLPSLYVEEMLFLDSIILLYAGKKKYDLNLKVIGFEYGSLNESNNTKESFAIYVDSSGIFKELRDKGGLNQEFKFDFAAFKKGLSIGSRGDTIYYEKKNSFEKYSSIIENRSVMSVVNNQLWVGTSVNGIYILDLDKFEIQDRINLEDGLLSNDIRAIHEDRQGTVWIGTAGGGLSRYLRSGFEHFDRSSGLGSNEINAVLHHDSIIYIANGRSGIYKIENDQVQKDPTSLFDELLKYNSIAKDQYGRMWAATKENGVMIYSTDSITQFRMDNGCVSNQIQKIIYDDRAMWIASAADGIQHIRIDSAYSTYGTLQHYSGTEGIKDLFITDILLVEDRLIYCTKEGSVGWIRDGVVSHFNNVIGSSVAINTIASHDGQIYIGTEGQGVWMSKISDNLNFSRIDGRYKLGSDRIRQIVVTDKGAIWIGHTKGLDQIVLNNKNEITNAINYGYNDGFVGVETTPRAATIDHQGRLWFGTVNGLTKYESTTAKVNYTKPQLSIDNIEVDYELIPDFEKHQKGEKYRLQLDPDKNNLSIAFRSVDLLHPDDVEYRWKVNFDDWSPWSPQREVTLANMSDGKYTFQVQSKNHAGYRSTERAFYFEITAPLWRQTWFQAVSVFGLLFLGFGLLVRYVNVVNKKARAEQKKLKEENHLLSLEQKALQLQMNPHFIFNVLHNIKALSLSDPAKARQIINEFAVLLRSILENSREKTISLETEVNTLGHYLKVEQHMSKKPFRYNLNIDEAIDLEETMIPPMLIQPFVENAIHHGIAAVKRSGEIDISFKRVGPYLNCNIRDNGIGIEESKKNKTSNGHNSVALSVTKDRIRSLDNRQQVNIKQLTDNDGNVAGTEVDFSIPFITDF